VASEVEKQPIVYVTDDQIYREFEICMNRAKAQIGDNKLEARRQATSCMMQLSKYGHDRAKKAFNIYWDLD
jgi:seryl-tRNA(Sec) selenium transferase